MRVLQAIPEGHGQDQDPLRKVQRHLASGDLVERLYGAGSKLVVPREQDVIRAFELTGQHVGSDLADHLVVGQDFHKRWLEADAGHRGLGVFGPP